VRRPRPSPAPRPTRCARRPTSDAPESNLVIVSTAEQIEIRRLGTAELSAHLDGLAAVLADCVEGGASVSYMAPFTHDDAREAFAGFAAEVEQGRRLLLAAFEHREVVGTVQVVHAWPPNQPHRADIA